MEDKFLTHWFRGFAEGLEKLSARERTTLLSACGKACSQSYSLGVYQDAYARSTDMESFLENLKAAFPELSYTISEDQKTVTIIYDHCACDLYTQGLVKSGLLCECSRRSLQYNWEAVMGEENVDVAMRQSILQGEDRCVFEVNINNVIATLFI